VGNATKLGTMADAEAAAECSGVVNADDEDEGVAALPPPARGFIAIDSMGRRDGAAVVLVLLAVVVVVVVVVAPGGTG
jgi:hypothetical protein